MLVTIRDDTWNVLNMQHITQIRKDGIIQISLVVALTKSNSSSPSADCMYQWNESASIPIMACRLFSDKPLSKQMLSIGPFGTNFCEIWNQNSKTFSVTKMHLKIVCEKATIFSRGRGVKGPSHIVEGGHHLRNSTSTSTHFKTPRQLTMNLQHVSIPSNHYFTLSAVHTMLFQNASPVLCPKPVT